MTEPLTAERFRPHVGENLALQVLADPLARPGEPPQQPPAGTVLPVELLEVRITGPEAFKSGFAPVRLPFSVTVRGPKSPILPQRIYRLEHPSLGAMELFLVPVARDATGVHYEACFT